MILFAAEFTALRFANSGLPGLRDANDMYFWAPHITRGDIAIGDAIFYSLGDVVFEEGDAYRVRVDSSTPAARPSETPAEFALLARSGELADDFRFVAGSAEVEAFGDIGLLDRSAAGVDAPGASPIDAAASSTPTTCPSRFIRCSMYAVI